MDARSRGGDVTSNKDTSANEKRAEKVKKAQRQQWRSAKGGVMCEVAIKLLLNITPNLRRMGLCSGSGVDD